MNVLYFLHCIADLLYCALPYDVVLSAKLLLKVNYRQIDYVYRSSHSLY